MSDGARELTFRLFQAANASRCPEVFNHAVSDWNLLEWAGAAAGEMGEVANVCKKLRRIAEGVGGQWAKKDPPEHILRAQLACEIGDVLAYLALLATAAGLDLGTCAAEKFDEVSVATGWKGPRLLAEPAPLAADHDPLAAVSRVMCGKDKFPGDLAQYVRNEAEGRAAAEARERETDAERLSAIEERDEAHRLLGAAHTAHQLTTQELEAHAEEMRKALAELLRIADKRSGSLNAGESDARSRAWALAQHAPAAPARKDGA